MIDLRFTFGATLAMTAALLSACAPSGDNLETRSGITNIDEITLPLDGHVLTVSELRIVREAHDELLSECVRRFTGEAWVPEGAVGTGPLFSPYRFGLVDPERAGRYGYHDPKDELSVTYARSNPVKVPRGDVTPAWVVDGVPAGRAPVPRDASGNALPAGGCSGETQARLAKPPAAKDVVDREVSTIERAEAKDPRVGRAIDDWVACMQAAGYEYESTLDPAAEFGAAETISDEELSVARADVGCRTSTHYLETRVAVLSELQQQSLDSNAAEWNDYRDWNRERLRAARGILLQADQREQAQSRLDEYASGS